ncbi:hypothetical protein FRB90_005407, partial [Tulasnella sp. 427]
QPGETERDWYFLIDFDGSFRDRNGEVKLLPRIDPTKDSILKILATVGKNGESGLVYYGGHGERGLPGRSELIRSGTLNLYREILEDPSASEDTYLLSIDAQRIYGKEIFSVLPENPNTNCVITVVFDTCNAEGLLTHAGRLPFVYDGSSESDPVPSVDKLHEELSQRVIVTAARVGETAGTVVAPESDRTHGILSWCMIDWIS